MPSVAQNAAKLKHTANMYLRGAPLFASILIILHPILLAQEGRIYFNAGAEGDKDFPLTIIPGRRK